MITQYDAIAEIEAMKWKRSRPARGKQPGDQQPPVTPTSWHHASEHAIRREMERRLARHAAGYGDLVA
jgi:hypothetical protein